MSTTREPFEFEHFYHVSIHTRERDNLFDPEEYYLIFMALISKYILDVATIYAYCLLPNHFHFLVQDKEKEVEPPNNFANKHESDYISHQWGKVQNTFSKKKNYRTGNSGGMFCQPTNRNHCFLVKIRILKQIASRFVPRGYNDLT